MSSRAALIVISVLAQASLALATWPVIPRPLAPALQAIRAAARLQDAAERGNALQKAVLDGLRGADREGAAQIIAFLEDNSQWIQMEELDAIIPELDRLGVSSWEIQSLVDMARLSGSTKEERLRVYAAAILKGESRYGAMGRLNRVTAMTVAALEGITELLPLIEANYKNLRPEEQRVTSLEQLRWSMRLGAGASDRMEAVVLSLAQAQQMGVAAVVSEARASRAFRDALTDACRFACHPSQIVDDANPTCIGFRDLYRGVTSELLPPDSSENAAGSIPSVETLLGEWADEFGAAAGVPKDGLPPHKRAASGKR